MVLFSIWLPHGLQPPRTPATPVAIFTCLGLHVLVKLLFASESTRQLHDQKRSGALELLLTTPITVASILNSQRAALRQAFALPFVGLLLVNAVLMAADPSSNREQEPVVFGGAVIAIFDFLALSWVGMLAGVREKNYARAVLRTFSGVMFLPWAVLLLFLFGFANRGVPSSTVQSFFLIWFVGAAIYDLVLAGWAQQQVRSRFRELAGNDVTPRLLFRPSASWRAVQQKNFAGATGIPPRARHG
jgi:hypothetical protein